MYGVGLLAAALTLGWTGQAPRAQPMTVFLNYSGGALSPGPDTARDQTNCLASAVVYPAFLGTTVEAQAITATVQRALEPYAVRVVDQRPPDHVRRTMVMLGGSPTSLGLDGGFGGFACEIDCGNVLGPQTVFVFTEHSVGPVATGLSAAHEIGHSLGLEHVDDEQRLMYPTTSGVDRDFGATCAALIEAPLCGDHHLQFCPDVHHQNADAELLAVVGPATLDVTPPTVDIVEPAADARFLPGQPVVVVVAVDDDREDVGWSLQVDELDWRRVGTDEPFELRFPAGVFTLTATATDQAGNATTVAVEIEVTPVAADPDSDPGPEPGAGESAGGDSTGQGDASQMPPSGEGATHGCRIEARDANGPSPARVLLLLALYPVRKRPRKGREPCSKPVAS